jgi:hypothetical protein
MVGRNSSATHMNDKSSRSHCILTLVVKRIANPRGASHDYIGQSQDVGAAEAPARNNESQRNESQIGREHFSKLILVDLGGNERDSARTGKYNEAALRAEGIDINSALAALGACIRLRTKSVPKRMCAPDPERHAHCANTGAGLYRASVLTRLLREPLHTAKIIFLACCSPVASCTVTTGQTLSYAAMVKSIRTNAEDSAVLLVQGMNKVPVQFLPHDKLVGFGRLPRSSDGLTVYLHELRVSVVRVMVSHRSACVLLEEVTQMCMCLLFRKS